MRLRICGVLVVFVAVIAAGASVARGADEYHVSAANGDDAAAGTAGAPWRTVQRAADAASPGSTVYVHEGLYRERVEVRVSGSEAAGFVTLRAAPGERAVLDGADLPDGGGDDLHLLRIEDRSYVRVQGLEFRRHVTKNARRLVTGIWVASYAGGTHHVELLDNVVHHIENRGAGGGNAHGIAVYGESAAPIHDVVVRGNEIFACRLGSSEALVLNGNVAGFVVERNRVHDCDNIGIDLIGFEGTAPSDDQARDGVVRDNEVWNITSYGNPAYGRDRSAGGIYVDGGRDIVVERNVCHHCDFGIEVASENFGRATTGVVVRDNVLWSNQVAGLAFGGARGRHGTARDCRFERNTLFRNDTTESGTGEILVQRANGCVVAGNVIVAGRQAKLISSELSNAHTFGNTWDRNLWFAGVAEVYFSWNDRELAGIGALRDASGDAAALFEDPLFVTVDGPTPDLRLSAGSLAIDAGDPAFVAADGELDADGNARVAGARVDLGAYEFGAVSAAPANPSLRGQATLRGVVGEPADFRLDVDGSRPFSPSVSSADLPAGLAFDGPGLRIHGVPLASGARDVPLYVANSVGTVRATLRIEIATPGHEDDDADAYPNELEDAFEPALRSDPARSPGGAGPPSPLVVSRLSIALDFRRRDRDTLNVTADVSLPAGAIAAGAEVAVYAGGALRRLVLDARGRAAPDADTRLSLVARADGRPARLRLTMRRASLASALADEGLVDATVPRPRVANRTLRVVVLFPDAAWSADVPLKWTARAGRTGRGTAP